MNNDFLCKCSHSYVQHLIVRAVDSRNDPFTYCRGCYKNLFNLSDRRKCVHTFVADNLKYLEKLSSEKKSIF